MRVWTQAARWALGAVAAAGALLAAPTAAAQAFNEAERAEIRAVVRDYLIRNPDVLDEAIQALQTHRQAEATRRMSSDSRDFAVGPRNAPVTVVEFFDYRCPYCHEVADWAARVIETRGDRVRFVFKELPILGPQSTEASRAALAAAKQGRYMPLHLALMRHRGQLTTDAINQLAARAGVDVARMRRDMAEPGIAAHTADTQTLAQDIGVSGTPTFFFNGEMVQGRPADLDRALDAALARAGR